MTTGGSGRAWLDDMLRRNDEFAVGLIGLSLDEASRRIESEGCYLELQTPPRPSPFVRQPKRIRITLDDDGRVVTATAG